MQILEGYVQPTTKEDEDVELPTNPWKRKVKTPVKNLDSASFVPLEFTRTRESDIFKLPVVIFNRESIMRNLINGANARTNGNPSVEPTLIARNEKICFILVLTKSFLKSRKIIGKKLRMSKILKGNRKSRLRENKRDANCI